MNLFTLKALCDRTRHTVSPLLGKMFDASFVSLYQSSDGVTAGTMVAPVALGATAVFNSGGSGNLVLTSVGATFNSRTTIRDTNNVFDGAASSGLHQEYAAGKVLEARVSLITDSTKHQCAVGFNRDHSQPSFPWPSGTGREDGVCFIANGSYWQAVTAKIDTLGEDDATAGYTDDQGPITTVPTADMHTLRVIMGYACKNAAFYIDDNLVWTTNVDLPNDSTMDTILYSSCSIRNRFAGSTDMVMTVDYVKIWEFHKDTLRFRMSL